MTRLNVSSSKRLPSTVATQFPSQEIERNLIGNRDAVARPRMRVPRIGRVSISGMLLVHAFTCSIIFTWKLKFLFQDVDCWNVHAQFAWDVLTGSSSYAHLSEPLNWIEINFYSHLFTPLYPFSIAIVDGVLIHDIYLSKILMNFIYFTSTTILVYKMSGSWKGALLFLSMPVTCVNAVGYSPTSPMTLFASTLFLYASLNIMKGKQFYLIGTLSGLFLVFTREINWVFFILPVFVLIAKYEHYSPTAIVKTLVFYILIPGCVYISWLFITGTAKWMLLRKELLDNLEHLRSPISFIVAMLITYFTLIPLSVAGIHRDSENGFILFAFVGILLVSRLIFPGPFWPNFFEQGMVPLAILGSRAKKPAIFPVALSCNYLMTYFLLFNYTVLLYFLS